MILSLLSAVAFPVGAVGASAKFKDVDQSTWYAPYVDYVVEHGLMNGTSSTTFVPNGVVTRAQYVQVLYALAGKPKTAKGTSFTDLKKGAYYENAVKWAAATGVTSGMTKTTFVPDRKVSREQAATFFRAYAEKIAKITVKESASLNGFPDKSGVSSYAVTPMRWAVGAKLISGMKSGKQILLIPEGSLTRAQLATMMKAFDEYLSAKNDENDKSKITFDPLTEGDEKNYVADRKISKLTGKVINSEHVRSIQYVVEIDKGHPIESGEVAINSSWEFVPKTFAYGNNIISVTATYDDGAVATDTITIYNTSKDNVSEKIINSIDTDNDGLSDYFELYNSGTSLDSAETNGKSDSNSDTDNDGLTNLEEYKFGSLSHQEDSDGDGLADKDEKKHGTDPLDRDSDDDGVEDGSEIDFGLNPNSSSDANTSVKTSSKKTFDDGKTISLDVTGSALSLNKVDVDAIPSTAIISPDNISGMIGNAFSLNAEGTITNAKISVSLPKEKIDDAASYGLYYINDENGTFERVPHQYRNNKTITATLEHFSNYVVLNDDQIFKAKGDLSALFQSKSDDYDRDGFKNTEDPTPWAADAFKSYEDYIHYFYNGKDVISFVVKVPKIGSSTVYSPGKGGGTGHTWSAFTHSNRKSDLFGFGSTEGNLALVLWNTTSWMKGPDYCTIHYMEDDSDPNNLIHNVPYSYDDDHIKPHKAESMDEMSLALPMVVDASMYKKMKEFADGYNRAYNLYRNNCTTFVISMFDALGVDTRINSYVPPTLMFDMLAASYSPSWYNISKVAVDAGDALFIDACSPGQAGYCIWNYYRDECVQLISDYKLKNGKTVKAFTSNCAKRTANFDSIKKYNGEGNQTIDKEGAISLNGHLYQLVDDGYSFLAAEELCKRNGGHLMTITSQEEQNVLEQLLKKGKRNSYWLGGYSNHNGSVTWLTGEKCTYTHWQPGQPDNTYGNENALMVYRTSNPRNPSSLGQWNDLHDDGTCGEEDDFFGLTHFGFVCEWE